MGEHGAQLSKPAGRDITWRDRAACRTVETGLFFDPARRVEAKRICAGCPVRTECETAGRGEFDGIWGGELPPNRGRLPRLPGRPTGPGRRGDVATFPFEDPRHGTAAGYAHLRCGCGDCREWARNARRRYTRKASVA